MTAGPVSQDAERPSRLRRLGGRLRCALPYLLPFLVLGLMAGASYAGRGVQDALLAASVLGWLVLCTLILLPADARPRATRLGAAVLRAKAAWAILAAAVVVAVYLLRGAILGEVAPGGAGPGSRSWRAWCCWCSGSRSSRPGCCCATAPGRSGRW